MKGFAQADWAVKAKVHTEELLWESPQHKAKFQQKFMLCPEGAEAESIFLEILIKNDGARAGKLAD